MQKLKLDVDAVAVDTFAAGTAPRPNEGTVHAHVTSINGTCQHSCFYTACVDFGTCGSTCEC